MEQTAKIRSKEVAQDGMCTRFSDTQSDLLKRSGIRWVGLPAHAERLLPAEAPPDSASGCGPTRPPPAPS